jgi:hypothetical protein
LGNKKESVFQEEIMRSSRNVFLLFAFLALFAASAAAQTTPGDAKAFTKDGLSFSYPTGWSFNDTSNADAQQMTFGRPDSDAQIRVFVFRTLIKTPEQLSEARKVLVDPYIASTVKQFEQMGAKPSRAPATTDIAALKGDGVRISASLDGDPGAAEIFWGVVGQRLVVLTRFGPDKALAKALPAWDLIRTTIKVEEPQPKMPQPVASPKP